MRNPVLPPVAGYVRLSLTDWPGHVAAVLFTQGCNMRCPWCHNKTLVYPDLFTSPLSSREVEYFISSLNQSLYDGVVISGGEPMIHTATLPNLLSLIKQHGLKIRIDTNGTNPDFLFELLDKRLVDQIALDYKLPLSMYPDLGCDTPDAVEKSIKIVAERGCGYIRSTLIAGVHSSDVFERMDKELYTMVKGGVKVIWRIQDYRSGAARYYNQFLAV